MPVWRFMEDIVDLSATVWSQRYGRKTSFSDYQVDPGGSEVPLILSYNTQRPETREYSCWKSRSYTATTGKYKNSRLWTFEGNAQPIKLSSYCLVWNDKLHGAWAPEEVSLQLRKLILTKQADIFAVALIAFILLTGEHPFVLLKNHPDVSLIFRNRKDLNVG